MTSTSLRVSTTPTRSVSRSRRGASLLVAAALLLVVVSCATGTVTTSTGATVPAATVHAQDLVGDALQALQDAHNAAVRAHDALKGQEPDDVHAQRRATLQRNAASLRAGWSGLEAWKLGSEGGSMESVVTPVRAALPDILTVCVSLKVVSQEFADAVSVFFGTAATGKTPAPLAKAGGAS